MIEIGFWILFGFLLVFIIMMLVIWFHLPKRKPNLNHGRKRRRNKQRETSLPDGLCFCEVCSGIIIFSRNLLLICEFGPPIILGMVKDFADTSSVGRSAGGGLGESNEVVHKDINVAEGGLQRG